MEETKGLTIHSKIEISIIHFIIKTLGIETNFETRSLQRLFSKDPTNLELVPLISETKTYKALTKIKK
jgi:hypothetical protein